MVGARAEPRRRVRAAPAVASEGETVTLMLPARTRKSAKLVVTVTDIGEAMHASSAIENAARLRKVQLFIVVFQSDELDRISKALRKDEQAKALQLSVELDTVGYHLHAPDGMKMVNPAWARVARVSPTTRASLDASSGLDSSRYQSHSSFHTNR